MFSSPFGLLFCYNQVRSILFYMCNFRLANKYSKTVQTEVREYTIVVLPEPELGKLRKKVQDHRGQSNTCFRKVTQHVDYSTSGTNGLNTNATLFRVNNDNLSKNLNTELIILYLFFIQTFLETTFCHLHLHQDQVLYEQNNKCFLLL